MLGNKDIIAFIPTKDPQRSREFYEHALGLKFVEEDAFAIVMGANGIAVRIVNVGDFTPFGFTILGWAVEDIEETVVELRVKGVTFDTYEGLEQDRLGIWTAPGGARVAWFKDPDGNVLSVSEDTD
jgi:catechol 2,3-dioxygenase-like lactoylglutathione lyase family enzyme